VLNVNRLRLLRELSRRGTLAAVAQAHSYSPSAVSQQLAKLQEEVGVDLLEHVGRTVILTPEAELLVEHADAVLQRLELAEAELAARSGDVAGTLRVASFQSVVMGWLPAVLDVLEERHPALRVDITVREPDIARHGLLAGDFDVILDEEYTGDRPHTDPRLDREPVADDPLQLVFPASWGPVDHLSELADASWTFEPQGTQAYEWCLAYCRSRGLEPDVRFEFEDLMTRLRFVETGHAATLLPRLGARLGSTAVHIQDLADKPQRRIDTVVRNTSITHPAIAAFRTAMADVASRDDRQGPGSVPSIAEQD